MSDYELITSEIAEELEAGSFTVKQRIFIKEYLKMPEGLGSSQESRVQHQVCPPASL